MSRFTSVESQHVTAGMEIVWGGGIRKVVATKIENNQVEWHLSGGATQILPTGIEVLIPKTKVRK